MRNTIKPPSTRRRGGSLPPGWWLAPAAVLGTMLWVL